MHRATGLAGGLLAGAVLDAVLADPRRGHPVAGFGRAAARVEQRVWRDRRLAGMGYAAACAGGAAALGLLIQRAGRGRAGYPAVVALATWVVLGGESLRREAGALHRLLEDGDLAGARERLTHLVGRDPAGLGPSEIARAGVESVAENTSDAVVAPLFWGAVAGVPGLLGYRAVNTLDAMVGHRSPRYQRFGWAAARLDDAANLVPARLTAILVAAVSGRPRAAWRAVRGDARRHPSPNAGWCEAAFAGALGIRLGGVNVYGDRVEQRPALGDGDAPESADLLRAAQLERRVAIAAALLAALTACGRR
ncbi:MAG TPA: cobalamin biosynthesis protein [Solirubrobacteraceae bacterium]|nr:cobalamin biosynthesis protein [Solirubrobacteraceae bacterium]